MATEGRPLVVGSDDGPEAPFPYQMEGKITTGFQRGSTLVRGFFFFLFPANYLYTSHLMRTTS